MSNTHFASLVRLNALTKLQFSRGWLPVLFLIKMTDLDASILYNTRGKLYTRANLKRYTGFTYAELANIYDELERVAPTMKEYKKYQAAKELEQAEQEELRQQGDEMLTNLGDLYEEYYTPENVHDLEQDNEAEENKDIPEKIQVTINGQSSEMTITDIKRAVARYLRDPKKHYFKYMVSYSGSDKWQTIPINVANISAIMSILEGKTAIDIIASGESTAVGSDPQVYHSEMPIISNIVNIRIDPYAYSESSEHGNKTNEGSFYPMYINTGNLELDTLLDGYLKRYQIFKDVIPERKEYYLNCFLYALKQSGKVSDKTIYEISLICTTRTITVSTVQKICERFGLSVNLSKLDKGKVKQLVKYNYQDITDVMTNVNESLTNVKTDGITEQAIDLILIPFSEDETQCHYIVNETVEGISASFFNNYDEIDKLDIPITDKVQMMKEGDRFRKHAKACHIKSYKLIELIREKGWFNELPEDTYYRINPRQPITNIKLSAIDLSNIESDCVAYNPEKRRRKGKPNVATEDIVTMSDKECKNIYFADFESDITKNEHVPYAIAYARYETENERDINFIYGSDCDTKFLNKLEDGAIVYFHNLGYDARMFNYANVEICNSIDKGAKIYTQKIRYGGKTIYLRDSLCLIPIKLAAFASSFGLSVACEKEMYPYKYYTIENINEPGDIDEAGKNEQPDKWNQEQFIKNVNKLRGCKLSGNKFSRYIYCRYYCCKDVHILKEGFKAFRDNFKTNFGIDVIDTVSASSLAQEYFKQNVYNKIPDLWEYRGHTHAFIRAAVYGGRVMTRDNVKHHVTETLNDFDAVSLYPSAIKRLYVVQGKPRELNKDELNWEYLKANTCGENENDKRIKAYIIEIDITKVGKALHFPLIVNRIYNGAGTCVKQVNENKCCRMVVDNILMEDLKQYQEIECEIKRGICWEGDKVYTIRDEIEKLHQERCKYKSCNQSMSFIVKLIMNSAYGKTIQKPIDNKTVYKKMETSYVKDGERITVHPAERYLAKNFNRVNSCCKLADNMVQINTMKAINDFASMNLIGVQILSMSKRIMNEVMTTAEDCDIPIYYQDTDSMHIENNRIPELAKAFKQKYGRELIGKELGQFHNDFDELGANPISIESYFLGKKAYIDKLTNDKGEEAYHIRLKGIPGKCIEMKASEFGGDIMKLYEYLYDGNEITFNLKEVLPCFRGTENRHMTSLGDMFRTVKF